MYEHKIYNNGTVNAQQGQNVGGLIGNNEGTLSAGYNTGSVRGQNNVGGIAGTNSGKISEVFNTIMTGEETGNRVSGADNVGGLVGNNTEQGTLTDAYNTTAVNGGTNTGNAVGSNEGDVNERLRDEHERQAHRRRQRHGDERLHLLEGRRQREAYFRRRAEPERQLRRLRLRL